MLEPCLWGDEEPRCAEEEELPLAADGLVRGRPGEGERGLLGVTGTLLLGSLFVSGLKLVSLP